MAGIVTMYNIMIVKSTDLEDSVTNYRKKYYLLVITLTVFNPVKGRSCLSIQVKLH